MKSIYLLRPLQQVKKIPLMNNLASGVHEPITVMDIVNCCMGHLEKGGGKNKDAKYIVTFR
jgi:hypothetical protein